MNWLSLVTMLVPLIKELLSCCQGCDNCSDEDREELSLVAGNVADIEKSIHGDEPPMTMGIMDWIGCVDIPRLVAALKELVAVIGEAMSCEPVAGVADSRTGVSDSNTGEEDEN